MGSGQDEMEEIGQNLHKEKVGRVGNYGLTKTTRTKEDQDKDEETVCADLSTVQDMEQNGTIGQF